jgi:hypothetical protein
MVMLRSDSTWILTDVLKYLSESAADSRVTACRNGADRAAGTRWQACDRCTRKVVRPVVSLFT